MKRERFVVALVLLVTWLLLLAALWVGVHGGLYGYKG